MISLLIGFRLLGLVRVLRLVIVFKLFVSVGFDSFKKFVFFRFLKFALFSLSTFIVF